MKHVLLLNADYSPIKTMHWHKAVSLVLHDKVIVAETVDNQYIRSPTISIEWPSVIILKSYVKKRQRAGLNRLNLLARDGFECQYCGAKPKDLSKLTMDHVVPRHQAVKGVVTLPWNNQVVKLNSWLNMACACQRCNNSKSNRTPREARMKLKSIPYIPRRIPIIKALLRVKKNPPEWEQYLKA